MAVAGSGGGGIGGGGGGGSGGSGGGGGSGGTRLMQFAVFGDCRPPSQNDTSHYPSAILGGVFKLAQQQGAQFVVGTGDYMFADNASAVAAQIPLFKQAAANYTAGPIYLTLGNHECDGYTNSNCPNLDETPNIQAFMANLAPPGATKPYFRIDVAAQHGKAKFLFVAANAWDTTQQSWLQTQLANPTTYTFVVRHEPITDSSAPGVTPSENLVQGAKLTLELNGHQHEYNHTSTNHVTSGNAGAPLNPGNGYGVLIVQETEAGDVAVQEIDEATGSVTDTWTVTADGVAK